MISPTHRPIPDNTQHSQHICIHAAGFEPATPASEGLQTHALGHAGTVSAVLLTSYVINGDDGEVYNTGGGERGGRLDLPRLDQSSINMIFIELQQEQDKAHETA
jgi:hypothetical protein